MADAYTGTPSVGWDQAAWDRLAYFAFRPEVHFDSLCDVQPTRQSMPGKTVAFTQVGDLAIATTALSESVDVDAVAMSDAQVVLTLAEFGNATITTSFLRAVSFLPVDSIQAEVIGANMGQSLDVIAANTAKSGTNVRYAKGTGTQPTSRVTVQALSTLTAHDQRVARADLKRANVPQIMSMGGGSYVTIIHPDVLLDLEEESGHSGWRDAHIYARPDEIYNGEFGKFEGFRYIETTNAPMFVDAGSGSTVDVYATLNMGRQALAKAYSTQDGNGAWPHVVQGPVTDKLRRFVPLGWYWIGAYGVFRQSALRRVESSSSIGANT
jgi:N4-gp56 family major capsid protein